MSASENLANLFRREYGNLVSLLAGRIGVARISDIEDAVQNALMAAVRAWPSKGQPDNPRAWLYAVARNQLLAELRSQTKRSQLLEQHADSAPTPETAVPETFLPEEIPDELLRMLFLACDPAIPEESQLTLALKILCGFGVKEIALALFTSEANVYKRLARARDRLAALPLRAQELSPCQYAERHPAVLKVIYLLFTEGHHSTGSESPTRIDFCTEAIRLADLLSKHPHGQSPQTSALLALLLFHHARSSARSHPSGGLVLLEDQDRASWNQKEIQQGLHWLAKSAEGDEFSRYHAEAGIAAEHCLAPSFNATRWDRIIACYDTLIDVSPSPIHFLNRAVALAEAKDPAAAIASLETLQPPTWLTGSYLWSAVLADLHLRAGSLEKAARFRELALKTAPTDTIRATLQTRFAKSKTKT